jgi:hypothetical protein
LKNRNCYNQNENLAYMVDNKNHVLKYE